MTMPDRVDIHIVEHRSEQPTVLTAEGPPHVIAAWLRALANHYDPPKPATRGGDDGPGPAAGLRTERRDTPDHTIPRNRNRAGFAAPKLETP